MPGGEGKETAVLFPPPSVSDDDRGPGPIAESPQRGHKWGKQFGPVDTVGEEHHIGPGLLAPGDIWGSLVIPSLPPGRLTVPHWGPPFPVIGPPREGRHLHAAGQQGVRSHGSPEDWQDLGQVGDAASLRPSSCGPEPDLDP